MGNGTTGAVEVTAPDAPPDIGLPDPDRFVGEPECHKLSNLGRVTRWRLEKTGQFPKPKPQTITVRMARHELGDAALKC